MVEVVFYTHLGKSIPFYLPDLNDAKAFIESMPMENDEYASMRTLPED